MIHSRSLAERIARGDLDEGLRGPLHARIRLRRLLRRGGLALNAAEGQKTPTHPPPLRAGEEITQDVPPPFAPADDPTKGR